MSEDRTNNQSDGRRGSGTGGSSRIAPGSASGGALGNALPDALPAIGASADDEEILEIERARRDPHAFAPLYERYADMIYGYCVRRVSDRELAADLTSQIFTRALIAIPRYRPGITPGTFRSWLFAIAHNLIVDSYRTRRTMHSLDAEETSHHLLHDSSPSPEDHALASDTRRALAEAMDQLTSGQRQVVELRLAGLSGPEIADVLGLHITAVKSSQLRAYARLRELMHDHVNLTRSTDEETTHG